MNLGFTFCPLPSAPHCIYLGTNLLLLLPPYLPYCYLSPPRGYQSSPESWQSRQCVQVYCFNSHYRDRCWQLGCLSIPPSFSQVIWALLACVRVCVWAGAVLMLQLVHSGGVHFNKDCAENCGNSFTVCLTCFHSSLTLMVTTSYSYQVCVWFDLSLLTTVKADKAKLIERWKHFKTATSNKVKKHHKLTRGIIMQKAAEMKRYCICALL